MNTRELTPGDRRELRSLVKKQFAVLRNDVKRRKDELVGEIESELLRRYREQDEHILAARREIEVAQQAYDDACQQIMSSLRDLHPNLEMSVGYQGRLMTSDANRQQLHRALVASVPQQIADASTKLDQEELKLLRDLTIGALDTEVAQEFLSRVPTVGQLVPKARLAEIEGGLA